MKSSITLGLVALIFILGTLSAIFNPLPAHAGPLTINTARTFTSLDGSVGEDDDGIVNGILTVNGNLTITGTGSITCNDPVSPANNSACPISIVVNGGNLEMQAGSSIYAENRTSGGDGGNISITVGGDFTLRGTSGATPGAIISSSRTTSGGTGKGGNITISVTGNIALESGSTIKADGANGSAGAITISAAKNITADGLVSSHSTLTGTGALQAPGGGPITITAARTLTISDTGQISSKGEDPGADLVHLGGCCGVVIDGLVESTGVGHAIPNNPANHLNSTSRPDKPANSTAGVEVWSGATLVIDALAHNGQINADTGGPGGSSGTSWIDLFAQSNITINGKTTGNFAVHANGNAGTNDNGGLITIKSVGGAVSASGLAAQADATNSGGAGGNITTQASQGINLNTSSIFARGDFVATGGFGNGGQINIRSFNSSISWQNGVGDVQPTGITIPAAQRGIIALTACTTVTTTATSFPSTGAATTPSSTTGTCGGAPVIPTYASLCTCPAPNITATKRDSLFTDADHNGVPSPGDVLLYTIVISNTGTTAADNVTYHDVITDTNITLSDNVTTTQGTIVKGNAGGNEVEVHIGDIPVGGSVTITFTVTIVNPLPAGVTQVSNQGQVQGDNFPSKPTDDPDTGAPDDPTITPVTAAPIIDAFKDFSLDVDADQNGVPSPGDTIKYTIIIENNGNQDASGVTFSDTPDTNTTLIVGSVTTSQGTITSGNSVGDTSVGVNLGTITGNHHSATITFKVIVTSPLPSGVTEVCNQGIVSSSNFHIEPTDDPNTQIDDDPTCVQLTAEPHIIATKHVALTDDFGSDGPGPSDNLTYTITILNNGNQNASGVTFSDTPDANTTLVVGSVITSGGTVITGNTPGDTTIAVNVGTVPGGGGTITISFEVTINDPFPPGVNEVCNQGSVSGDNFRVELTDDPDTVASNDPTCITVTATPSIHTTKTDVMFTDEDNNGVLSPGDTLEYFISILNNGNTTATGVTYSDTPDANTALVVGSVTTSQGTVTTGNTGGDTTVGVNVGDIAVGVTVEISFKVTINSPFPLDVTQVCNQGTVSGTNFSDAPTDNPDTEALNDPTCTPVTAAPFMYAAKTDSLFTDNDQDLIPSPGDVLLYTIVITNSGNTVADNVTYSDIITDPNLTLNDNVTTTQGTIISGNAGGNTVQVDIGQIPAGASENVTFQVTVADPLPAGVTEVCNQGLVTGNNFSTVLTDDPDTLAPDDPTCTPLTAAPLVDAFKEAALFTDADNNGIPSPGDTIMYTITIENNGNQDATGIIFSDTPGANTTLVVGSVSTSQGTITTGNNAGDSTVSVNLGTIPGNHGSATVTFKVTIDSPVPPGVTEVCNQGIVSGDNINRQPTDDPATEVVNDPTCTQLTATPHLIATKDVALTNDVPPGGPSPSDTFTYTITITNTGNQNAAGVVFTDTPDANTTLVVGSVTTSSGTIVSGNTAGDTSVEVDIPTIAGGGGTVTISFQVTVLSQLPSGVTDVCNQGQATALNVVGTLVTDDPNTEAVGDPTCVTVTADPSIHATKRWVLTTDADGNGVPSTGDTITYLIVILNNGNAVAQNVQFTDIPDPNSTLVVGSVTTNLGTVVHGNNAGDTTVNVNVGNIAVSAAADISFRVTIDCGNFNQIQNQGNVTGDNFSPTVTDDPTTQPLGDPTVTPIVSTACPQVQTGPTPTPTKLKPSPSLGTTGLNNPAQFCIRFTRCKPRILPGQSQVIATNVINNGDTTGAYNVVLKINGKIEQQKLVTVGPRMASPISFTVVKTEPGTYNVSIDNDNISFIVDAQQQATNKNAGPVIAIFGLLLSLLFVVVLLLARRRFSAQ